MSHQGLYGYVEEENIFALHTFKIKERARKYKSFSKKWVRENQCLCVNSVRKGEALNCMHLKEAEIKEFGKEDKKIWNLSLELIKRGTLQTYTDQQWLKRWKL